MSSLAQTIAANPNETKEILISLSAAIVEDIESNTNITNKNKEMLREYLQTVPVTFERVIKESLS